MIDLRNVKTEDCYILFKWANDTEARQNSFNKEVIEINNHIEWFKSKINDKNCYMFIITKENIDTGQIRVDIKDEVGIISYSVDRHYRGRGIGTEALRLIKNKFEDIVLLGRVKKENTDSIKSFEKAGYHKIEKENYIEFVDKIK